MEQFIELKLNVGDIKRISPFRVLVNVREIQKIIDFGEYCSISFFGYMEEGISVAETYEEIRDKIMNVETGV